MAGRAAAIKHVVGLDLLRLAAALVVMCYHFGFWNWTPGQPLARALDGHVPGWGAHLHFGWVGVEVFFVISGFVIAFTAVGVTPTAFFRSRLLRLAPVSWLAATVVFAVLLWLHTQPASRLLALYVGTLVFWPLNAIDGVWWTLGIEVDFYLLVFCLIRFGREQRLEAVMVGIGLLSGLYWCAALTLQALLPGGDGLAATLRYLVLKSEGNRELQLLLVQHGCLFAFGVVLWAMTASGVTGRRVLTAAVLFCACLLEIIGQNGIIARAAATDLSAMPALVVWTVAMLLLVLSIVFNDGVAQVLRRVGPGVRLAGLMTYPLYLLHDAVGIGVAVALAPFLGGYAVPAALAAALAVSLLTAWAVEPRLRRLLSACLPEAWGRARANRLGGVPSPAPAQSV